MKNNTDHERLDSVTSARLARLAARQVETTQLERRLEQAMAAEVEPRNAGRPSMPARWRRWWRPVTSAAAAIVIVFAIGWLALDGGSSPAMAAPAKLAQIHYDVANGLAPDLQVSTIEEANRLLADQANGVVRVPELPGIMKSCCLQPHAGATLTCALIERDGRMITVAIADGAKLHSPHGRTITRGDRRFIAHAANGINMVMAHESGRWLCVMGEVDFAQLADIAADIRL